MDFPLLSFNKKELQNNIHVVEIDTKIGNKLLIEFEEALQILYKLLIGSYDDIGANLGKFTEDYEIDVDSVQDSIREVINYWISLCNRKYQENKYKFQILSVTVGEVYSILNEVKVELTIETTEGLIKTILKLG